jgi:hypothetical protein
MTEALVAACKHAGEAAVSEPVAGATGGLPARALAGNSTGRKLPVAPRGVLKPLLNATTLPCRRASCRVPRSSPAFDPYIELYRLRRKQRMWAALLALRLGLGGFSKPRT